jgi:hypothetical protein
VLPSVKVTLAGKSFGAAASGVVAVSGAAGFVNAFGLVCAAGGAWFPAVWSGCFLLQALPIATPSTIVATSESLFMISPANCLVRFPLL